MKRTSLRGLYAITPEGLDTSVLTVRAEAALKGGARILQYRDKTKPVSLQVTEARKLCALCHRFGALLIVNDSLPLALAVNADGVHLGSDDGDLADARRQLGPDKVLGASCYADFNRAKAAAAAGAAAGLPTDSSAFIFSMDFFPKPSTFSKSSRLLKGPFLLR